MFDELHTLKNGSSVHIQDDIGNESTFVVRAFRIYTPDEVAIDVFSSRDDKAHLNLVTCQGVWDGVHQTYSHRLVIFTDKE